MSNAHFALTSFSLLLKSKGSIWSFIRSVNLSAAVLLEGSFFITGFADIKSCWGRVGASGFLGINFLDGVKREVRSRSPREGIGERDFGSSKMME
jgi:hypothetical protein